MSSQVSLIAPLRPLVHGVALAAAATLLFAAPALAGGPDKDKGHGSDGSQQPSFVKLAHDDDHFFDHITNQTRHCTDGHGHDAEHNPHCHPVSP
jgi:hypothetical protein